MADEFPHIDGVEHRYVAANGITLHVAEAGPRDADPVVLLHGWPQHWWEWRGVIGPLAEDHRVICPDLRGLGWSEAPPSGYEKETLADDIVALLDELGLERVCFAGHDWGGWVGFLIGLREPERIERFLALNTVPPFAAVTVGAAVAMWRFWYQWVIASPFGARAVAAGVDSHLAPLARWLGAGVWNDEEWEIFLGQLREPARARASVQYYRRFALSELPAVVRGRYRRVHYRVPTRIVFGTGDRPLGAGLLKGCERYADDLTVELVPNVGHMIVDERPDLVIARARELFG